MDQPQHMAVGSSNRCVFGTSAGAPQILCTGALLGQASLVGAAPFRGGAGHGPDICVWSDSALRCAGPVGTDPQWEREGACIVDADVGDSFRCFTDGGGVDCTTGTIDVTAGAALRGTVAIAAGGEHVCSLDQVGTVHCWGKGELGQLGRFPALDGVPNEVDLGGPVEAVASGRAHSCALDASGGNQRLRCWGDNSLGQICSACAVRYPTPVVVPLPNPLP
jgi:hypothetical protein